MNPDNKITEWSSVCPADPTPQADSQTILLHALVAVSSVVVSAGAAVVVVAVVSSAGAAAVSSAFASASMVSAVILSLMGELWAGGLFCGWGICMLVFGGEIERGASLGTDPGVPSLGVVGVAG